MAPHSVLHSDMPKILAQQQRQQLCSLQVQLCAFYWRRYGTTNRGEGEGEAFLSGVRKTSTYLAAAISQMGHLIIETREEALKLHCDGQNVWQG